MLCNKCMIIMRSGTSYHQKKDRHDTGYKRFNECPKCHDRIYNNSPNFQETLSREFERIK